MEIRYPNYYKKFHCIAGACPDTCCAGWEIPVDKASEQRYREVSRRGKLSNKEFVRKLKKHVKNGHIVSENELCPFLNKDGLCEMYIELGPEALCHTCARHPRHLEDYGNLHEMVLLLSCPEVARLILEENDGGFYVRQLLERQGNSEGIDQELLELLLKARELIWKWNADEKIRVDESMALSVALAHDLQRRISENDYSGMRQVLEKYDVPEISVKFTKGWNKKNGAVDKDLARFFLMSDFMEELTGLETICRAWPEMLESCRLMLYHSRDSRVNYGTKRQPEAEQDKRKLFEYFVYSFALSSLYDGDLLMKMKMAVLCTMAVEELYTAAKCLSLDQRANICHAIARQIENCDENRAQLERMLKQEQFGARNIINALLESEE